MKVDGAISAVFAATVVLCVLGAAGDWNVSSLKELLESRLDAADKRYEQRFVAQEKATAVATATAKEAVLKAEAAAEKRLDSVNEFRGQLKDQANTLMPKIEADAKIDAVKTRVAALEEQQNKLAGRSSGISDWWGFLVGALGLVAGGVSIAISLHKTKVRP